MCGVGVVRKKNKTLSWAEGTLDGVNIDSTSAYSSISVLIFYSRKLAPLQQNLNKSTGSSAYLPYIIRTAHAKFCRLVRYVS